jgi:hypothetical protein
VPLIERDFELLRALSELVRKSGSEWVGAEDAETASAEAGISGSEFTESLDVLRHRRLIDAETGISGNLLEVKVTAVGFDAYALHHVDEYETLLGRAAWWLFEHRDDHPSNRQLAAAIDVDPMLANHIIRVLGSRGWLRHGSMDMAGGMPVYDMSPELARLSDMGGDRTMEAE